MVLRCVPITLPLDCDAVSIMFTLQFINILSLAKLIKKIWERCYQ